MSLKVKELHRQKRACVYVRQSTMGQVRHHRESTERQYALRDKAVTLGWLPDQIQVLDGDLGMSGAQSSGREDFKAMVAAVSLGEVGAIFALEASRLARSSLDWHRLIEICAFSGTLVIDEDGCYEPADFNDRLLLGLKAQMAQAELHTIRARLQGGKLNKARKGALRFPLPVGLCFGDDDQIVLDPDTEVQGAVRLLFAHFRQTGSAYAVVQAFLKKGMRFPKRAYGGAWAGKLIWGRLSHARVLGVLKNPSYAGVYVYGRHRQVKEITSDGEVHSRSKLMPIDEWHTTLYDHHPGYIGWEEFLRNQEILEKNRTNGEETLLSGPAREGLALLQGLLLCSKCGRRISVRYKGNGGIYPTYDCSGLRREARATTSCLSVRCDLLDSTVSARVLEVLEPAKIEVAYEAVRQLEIRDNAVSKQWEMRIERAEYEANLAERRYEEVDPSNRLVASTLEERWNKALVALEALRREYAAVQARDGLAVTEEQRARAFALAQDFPRLWNAPTTQARDRKRMLRLLIKDVTVEKAESKVVVLHVRWQGDACEDLVVSLPPSAADQVRYPTEVVERVRELAQELPDEKIAESLIQEGRRPTKGSAFNVSIIRWIRYKHNIPAAKLQRPGELTVAEVAERYSVRRGVVYYWIERGVVDARRRNAGSPYWITVDSPKDEELRRWVRDSTKISKQRNQSESEL
jgi:DNA invertase Pin-like site-specific DNA recombinase